MHDVSELVFDALTVSTMASCIRRSIDYKLMALLNGAQLLLLTCSGSRANHGLVVLPSHRFTHEADHDRGRDFTATGAAAWNSLLLRRHQFSSSENA